MLGLRTDGNGAVGSTELRRGRDQMEGIAGASTGLPDGSRGIGVLGNGVLVQWKVVVWMKVALKVQLEVTSLGNGI